MKLYDFLHPAEDKIKHFSICGIISLLITILFIITGSSVFHTIVASVFGAMGTGVGKEVGDKFNPYSLWDWHDLIADFAGSVIGTCIGLIILIFV